MIRVFVYGTLMKNCYNHENYLGGQKFLGRAVLPGYALYNLGSYPGVVRDEEERVLGEVYEIDQQVLEQLDWLEDNGWLYTRQSAWIWLNKVRVSAEVYVWNGTVRKEQRIEFCSQPWHDGNVF